jgi:hypothetical protein
MPVTNFVFIKSTDFSKLEKRAADVRAIDGVSHVFYGPKIEDPQVSVLVAGKFGNFTQIPFFTTFTAWSGD